MWSYNVKMHMLSKIHDKMFRTLQQATHVRKNRDTLHIQVSRTQAGPGGL